MDLIPWTPEIVVMILSTYPDRKEKLVQTFKNVGIDAVNVYFAERCKGFSTKQTHHYIFQRHGDIWEAALALNRHILVFEEDVDFLDPFSGWHIRNALRYCERNNPSWKLLFPGHVPCGPLLPPFQKIQGGSILCRTSFPFAAHSYIIRKEFASQLVKSRSRIRWDRPSIIEGWTIIPHTDKYAVIPSLTSQTQWPKEVLSMFPRIRSGSFVHAMHVMHLFWFLFVAVLLFILCVLLPSQ